MFSGKSKEQEEGQEDQPVGGKAIVTIKFLADKDKLKKIMQAVGEGEEEGLGSSGAKEPK